MDNRGISIAEGDILVLCIRLFSELLISRYTLPQPNHPETLLSKHAAAVFTRASSMLASFPKGHRDERFNALLLPQSEPAICALGHAMAYSYAMEAGVPQPLLDLFELAIIKLDHVWYLEHAGITEDVRLEREDRAVRAALPHLREYVDKFDIRKYVTAPIISDSAWNAWMAQLKVYDDHPPFSISDSLFEQPLFAFARL